MLGSSYRNIERLFLGYCRYVVRSAVTLIGPRSQSERCDEVTWFRLANHGPLLGDVIAAIVARLNCALALTFY